MKHNHIVEAGYHPDGVKCMVCGEKITYEMIVNNFVNKALYKLRCIRVKK
jgi:hypothetical protein